MPSPNHISEETIREIRNNLPLLKLIVSRKTKLDALNWGLCPFHKEKTPSFHVFFGADRARYHCFGCGATGDIFNYIQRSEYINFKLAVIKLKYLIRNSGISPFPTERLEPPVRQIAGKTNGNIYDEHQNPKPLHTSDCYLNCRNYAELEELYKTVWEENQKFRVWLNLGNFETK